MRKIMIDTDPGIDDAAALAIALFDETLEVALITTVAGNVNVEHTTENALRLLAFWGKKTPVASGAEKPLLGALKDASLVHGVTGLAGFEEETPAMAQPLAKHAVEAMREVLLGSNEKITLVSIGPLTNLALLFSTYPQVKQNVEEIIMMGGSTARGNVSPLAEFNIAVDPEAAKLVFEAGIKITMVGLDIGRKAKLSRETCEKIKAQGRTGTMLFKLFEHYHSTENGGVYMYDSTALAYLLCPELFTTIHCFVGVETQSPLTRGATVCDLQSIWGKTPNAWVCTDVDAPAFERWMLAALQKAN